MPDTIHVNCPPDLVGLECHPYSIEVTFASPIPRADLDALEESLKEFRDLELSLRGRRLRIENRSPGASSVWWEGKRVTFKLPVQGATYVHFHLGGQPPDEDG